MYLYALVTFLTHWGNLVSHPGLTRVRLSVCTPQGDCPCIGKERSPQRPVESRQEEALDPSTGLTPTFKPRRLNSRPQKQEWNAGESRRASVPSRLLLPPPKGAVPSPSNSKTKRKAPRPTEEMTQDAGRRRSKEGTVDSRSAMAYAGSTLPRPRLTKIYEFSFVERCSASSLLRAIGGRGDCCLHPLPPRKHQRNHSRSSSLDLNLVFQDGKRS